MWLPIHPEDLPTYSETLGLVVTRPCRIAWRSKRTAKQHNADIDTSITVITPANSINHAISNHLHIDPSYLSCCYSTAQATSDSGSTAQRDPRPSSRPEILQVWQQSDPLSRPKSQNSISVGKGDGRHGGFVPTRAFTKLLQPKSPLQYVSTDCSFIQGSNSRLHCPSSH
jgi:hypothetical protein